MRNLIVLSLLMAILMASCKPTENGSNTSVTMTSHAPTEADKILSKSIEAHGAEKYNTAHYSFVFRKKQYTFHYNGN